MLDILYEDNHIIVAYKPYNVLSQADNTNTDDMLTLLKDYIKVKYNKPGNVYLGLVHRLDRNTEGIMVFARTSKAAKRLQASMLNNDFSKHYIAVVEGIIKEDGYLENYILKDEIYKKAYINNNGKLAKLSYKVINSGKINNQDVTYLRIELETGRFHQIRCQFSNIGHPLYGDYKYGSKNKVESSFLQAYSLEIEHPTTKEHLSFTKIDNNNLFKGILMD